MSEGTIGASFTCSCGLELFYLQLKLSCLHQESPRQTKPKKRPVHELFPGAFLNKKFNVNRACFPKEKHQNPQKCAKFINFSFSFFLFLVWFAAATPDYSGNVRAIHLWGRSGRGHCRKMSANFREISANFPQNFRTLS